MNPIKTIYIYIYYESSLTNYLSKSTTAPPSSTCQLSFLEFQFPLKKKKKIQRISLLLYDRSNIPFKKNPSIYFFRGKGNFKRARVIHSLDGNSYRITRPGLTPFLRSIFPRQTRCHPLPGHPHPFELAPPSTRQRHWHVSNFHEAGRLLCSSRSVCFLAPSFRLDKFISPPIASAPPFQPFCASIH